MKLCPHCGANVKAVDLSEDALRAINKLENVSDLTANNRRLIGIDVHTGFKEGLKGKECIDFPGIRPDYYNEVTKQLSELKPFNRRALRAGVKQLLHYQDVIGEPCNKILEFYEFFW